MMEPLDTDTIAEMIFQMLPPGEAWQTGMSLDVADSVMRAFCKAIAQEARRMDEAACLVFTESFAFSSTENLDLWQAEFGLPDECDPFGGDVAAKIRAQGHSPDPAWYIELAAALGWTIEAKWLKDDDPLYPGVKATLLVTIDATNSEALGFTPMRVPFELGRGITLGLPPAPAVLQCQLDRIVPAEIAIEYVVI
jgi:uncharacterized protein YmfQ (DUF2313 family)